MVRVTSNILILKQNKTRCLETAFMLIISKYFPYKIDVDTLYFAKSLFLRLFTINFHNHIYHRYTYVVYVPSSDVDATNANSENILKPISQTDTS